MHDCNKKVSILENTGCVTEPVVSLAEWSESPITAQFLIFYRFCLLTRYLGFKTNTSKLYLVMNFSVSKI